MAFCGHLFSFTDPFQTCRGNVWHIYAYYLIIYVAASIFFIIFALVNHEFLTKSLWTQRTKTDIL